MYPWSRFAGDNNEILKYVQRELYWSLLPHLYAEIKSRYLWSIRYVGVETDLSKIIYDTYKFDHRILQRPYEKIAAYYRYEHQDHDGQLVLPFTMPDLPKLSTGVALKEHYRREWCSFWYEEVISIAKEDIIARAVLTAIAYENTDDGYEAEELILELLNDRYGKSWDTDVLNYRNIKREARKKNMLIPPNYMEYDPWR